VQVDPAELYRLPVLCRHVEFEQPEVQYAGATAALELAFQQFHQQARRADQGPSIGKRARFLQTLREFNILFTRIRHRRWQYPSSHRGKGHCHRK
jgi:hypothetical protein